MNPGCVERNYRLSSILITRAQGEPRDNFLRQGLPSTSARIILSFPRGTDGEQLLATRDDNRRKRRVLIDAEQLIRSQVSTVGAIPEKYSNSRPPSIASVERTESNAECSALNVARRAECDSSRRVASRCGVVTNES